MASEVKKIEDDVETVEEVETGHEKDRAKPEVLPDFGETIEHVEPPPEDLVCGICLQILSDPTLTDCCGHHFCRECIDRVIAKDKVCPFCKGKEFKTLLDKSILRKVRDLKVYCSMKAKGCGWVGELGVLDRHLAVGNGTCGFVEVECEFGAMGCVGKILRKDLESHGREFIHKHLSLVSCWSLKTIGNFQERMKIKDDQIDELTKRNQRSEKSLDTQSQRMEKVEKQLLTFIPPPDFTLTDFAKHKDDGDTWCSPPFYSHLSGYKMCVRVRANGYRDGEGTHISVFVTLMRGEFDDCVTWPFRGDVTVQLLNQRGEEGHAVTTVPFDDTTPDTVAGIVVGREIAVFGWGKEKFTPHTELECNSASNTEYLANDCLKFRVSNVKLTHPL